jgi:anti-anti-sigma factor
VQYSIVEHTLNICEVRLVGRIDASVTPQLKTSFKALTRDGRCNILLDLREVTLIDSSGLGLLSSLLHATTACGGYLRCVVDTSSAVFVTLTLVRFDLVLSLYPTPDEAMRAFKF